MEGTRTCGFVAAAAIVGVLDLLCDCAHLGTSPAKLDARWLRADPGGHRIDPGNERPPDDPGDLCTEVEALRAKLRESQKHGLSVEELASIKKLIAAIGAILPELNAE